MASSADFQLWNKENKGGGSSSYKDAQAQSGILNTNSLETYDSTWVIIFSKNNYDPDLNGDYKKIGPNTYLNHLKNVDRGDDGDNWENDVKSFVLYKTKPAWWNNSSRPSYNDLFKQSSGLALFTKGTNYDGSNGVFTAPYSAVDLLTINYTSSGYRMDDEYDPGNISSISTGPNTWLLVYDGNDCTGNFYKIDPNTMLPDLSTVDRCDMNGVRQGDWANDISSFLLYAEKPIFWDTIYPGPYLDSQSFCDAFPYASLSGNDVEYVVVNNNYTVDYPDTLQSATQSLDAYHGAIDMDNLPADGWTSFYVTMKHHNVAGKNDNGSFYLIFDNNSQLVDIQHFVWTSNDDAYSIDETTIATVDLDLEVLGDETAVETGGVTIVVANVVAAVFDTVCGVFNHVAASIFQKHDDGGRFYFLPVMCHTINRLSTTIFSNYGESSYVSSDDPRANMTLEFNADAFKSGLQSADSNFSSIDDWAQFSGGNTTSDNNNVMEAVYQGYNYRTWFLETSMTQDIGMLVSCKIDYEVESGDNDHVIMMVGFTMPTVATDPPILAFAQAMIQFVDDSDDNIISELYSSGNTDDIVGSLYNDLQGQLSQLTFDDGNGGRAYLADIAKANLMSMVSCTITTSK